MANISVPSPGKWISDIFGKHIFRQVSTFSKNEPQKGPQRVCARLRKGSYIDPLVMSFSLNIEFLIRNFNHFCTFSAKPYYLFLQYRKSVLNETQISGHIFEPCSSCVDVDLFSEKNDFWKTETPQKGHL